MVVHYPAAASKIIAPEPQQQLLSGKNPARIFQKKTKQLVFFGLQLFLLPRMRTVLALILISTLPPRTFSIGRSPRILVIIAMTLAYRTGREKGFAI